jgi:hypothetical protein
MSVLFNVLSVLQCIVFPPINTLKDRQYIEEDRQYIEGKTIHWRTDNTLKRTDETLEDRQYIDEDRQYIEGQTIH